MPAPTIATTEVARIDRPARRDAPPSSLLVLIRTMAPAGAPPTVRPRWIEVSRRSPPTRGRTSLETTVRINRHELAALIQGLQQAAAALASDPEADPSA